LVTMARNKLNNAVVKQRAGRRDYRVPRTPLITRRRQPVPRARWWPHASFWRSFAKASARTSGTSPTCVLRDVSGRRLQRSSAALRKPCCKKLARAVDRVAQQLGLEEAG